MSFEPGANIPPINVYPDKYAGQVILITGAAQGIGEVTAKLFASEGATVVMVDIQEDKLKNVLAAIESQKGTGKATYRICNIGDDKQVDALIEEVVTTYGKIDVLVHLAAVYPFIPIIGHSTADYHRIINVNMDACFFLTRAVLPYMQRAGYGRIINTSSGTLQLPDRGLVLKDPDHPILNIRLCIRRYRQ